MQPIAINPSTGRLVLQVSLIVSRTVAGAGPYFGMQKFSAAPSCWLLEDGDLALES